MANKRQLKKFIRNTCGALAAEIVLARAAFPSIDRKEVHDIVRDIARLQCTTLAKTGISFDKTPRDFETPAEYHRERRAYFTKAFDRLIENFDDGVTAIIKSMNAALPEDVRMQIKQNLAE